jgi:hypothetical protein
MHALGTTEERREQRRGVFLIKGRLCTEAERGATAWLLSISTTEINITAVAKYWYVLLAF